MQPQTFGVVVGEIDRGPRVTGGLGVCVHFHRRARGPFECLARTLPVAGNRPMASERGIGVAAPFRAAHYGGDTPVPGGTFAGRNGVVEGLADEAVREGVFE